MRGCNTVENRRVDQVQTSLAEGNMSTMGGDQQGMHTPVDGAPSVYGAGPTRSRQAADNLVNLVQDRGPGLDLRRNRRLLLRDSLRQRSCSVVRPRI